MNFTKSNNTNAVTHGIKLGENWLKKTQENKLQRKMENQVKRNEFHNFYKAMI